MFSTPKKVFHGRIMKPERLFPAVSPMLARVSQLNDLGGSLASSELQQSSTRSWFSKHYNFSPVSPPTPSLPPSPSQSPPPPPPPNTQQVIDRYLDWMEDNADDANLKTPPLPLVEDLESYLKAPITNEDLKLTSLISPPPGIDDLLTLPYSSFLLTPPPLPQIEHLSAPSSPLPEAAAAAEPGSATNPILISDSPSPMGIPQPPKSAEAAAEALILLSHSTSPPPLASSSYGELGSETNPIVLSPSPSPPPALVPYSPSSAGSSTFEEEEEEEEEEDEYVPPAKRARRRRSYPLHFNVDLDATSSDSKLECVPVSPPPTPCSSPQSTDRVPFSLLSNQMAAIELGFIDWPPYYKKWRDMDENNVDFSI